MSIYRCIVQDYNWKVAKFLIVKNKAHANAFLYIAVLFSPTTSASAAPHLHESLPSLRRGGLLPFRLLFRTLPA